MQQRYFGVVHFYLLSNNDLDDRSLVGCDIERQSPLDEISITVELFFRLVKHKGYVK